MGILDRQLFRGVALRTGAVTLIILVMLSLENVSRLAADVERSNAPFRLLAQLTGALIPEHLSVALPIALMLGTALTVRQMALRGEWQIMAAAGMSRSRILAAPMMVGALVAGILLIDRIEWRPAGERALDAIYVDMRAGAYGIPLPIGERVQLAPNTTLFASGSDSEGRLTGVAIERDGDLYVAPTASVGRGENGGVAIDLDRGVSTVLLDGTQRRLNFETMRIAGRPPIIDMVGNDFRHRLDRLPLGGLVDLMDGQDRDASDAAAMALVMRVDSALFGLLVVWMAMVFGLPGRRRHSAIGIGVAVTLIVLHMKTASFVEDSFAGHALVAEAGHLLLWGGIVRAAVWLEARLGEGYCEELVVGLRRLIGASGSIWPNFVSPRLPRKGATLAYAGSPLG